MYDTFCFALSEIGGNLNPPMNKKELNQKIGERIVAIRESKGLSQSDLARLCMKDRQTLDKLEKGKVNPSIYFLYEISLGLRVPLPDLVNIAKSKDV